MFKLARIVFAATLFAFAVTAASPLVALVLSVCGTVNACTVVADMIEEADAE